MSLTSGLAVAGDYSVSGRVVEASTDAPVRKAVLTFHAGSSHSSPILAISDQEGIFTATGFSAGSYELRVERGGFLPYVHRQPVTLRDQNVTGIVVRLLPQAVVSGRAIDDDGEPLAGVRIAALRCGYRNGRPVLTEEASVRTDDRGEYRAAALPPARYIFRAVYRTNAFQGRGYVPIYYPGVTDARSAVQVRLAPGDSRQIDFFMQRSRMVRVSGKISGAGLGIRPRLTLLPRGAGGDQYRRQPTSAGPDGRFEFLGVPPGEYTLVGELFRGRASYGFRQDISVGDRDLDGLELQLAPAQDVRGKASVEGGADVHWNRVILLIEGADTGRGIEVRPGAEGTFDLLQLMPERFTVRVKELPPALFLGAARFGDQDVMLAGMDLSAGASGRTLELVFNSGAGELSGSVLDSEKRAAADATVVLIPEASRRNRQYLFKAAESDAEGRFKLSGIDPGDYVVCAWESIEPEGWFDPAIVAGADRLGERITIAKGGRHSLQLSLISATAISANR